MKATIQQGPGLALSATIHPSSRVTSSANHKHWIGLQRLDGKRPLEQIDLPGSTEEKIITLRRWRDSKIGPYHRFWQYALCKRYYIGIGCLQQTSGSEATFHETQFEALVRNEVLTKGFRRPSSLADETGSFERLLSCKPMDAHKPIQHEHALVIGLEPDRARLAWSFVVWAVLALITGAAVAFATHKLVTGAAVGGGLLGFVAVVQAACIFAQG